MKMILRMRSLQLLVLYSAVNQAFGFGLRSYVDTPKFASGPWSLSQEGYVSNRRGCYSSLHWAYHIPDLGPLGWAVCSLRLYPKLPQLYLTKCRSHQYSVHHGMAILISNYEIIYPANTILFLWMVILRGRLNWTSLPRPSDPWTHWAIPGAPLEASSGTGLWWARLVMPSWSPVCLIFGHQDRRYFAFHWFDLFPGENGLQGIRLFTPCDDEKCDIFEDQHTVRLTSDRWYPSSVRLYKISKTIMMYLMRWLRVQVRIEDGSVLIFGWADFSCSLVVFFSSLLIKSLVDLPM